MKDKLAGPEELERLESEATPGPWFREGAPYYDQHRWITVNAPDGQLLAMGGPNREDVLAQDREKADASLIVALRNAAPQLIAVLRAAMEADLSCQAGRGWSESSGQTFTCLDWDEEVGKPAYQRDGEPPCDHCRIYELLAPFQEPADV